MLNQLIDSGLLIGQIDTLIDKHEELKRAIFAKSNRIEDLTRITTELEDNIRLLSLEESRIKAQITTLTNSLLNLEQDKKTSIDSLNSIREKKVKELELEISQLSEELRANALEALSIELEEIKGKEVSRLNSDLERIKEDLAQRGQALEEQYQKRAKELEAQLLQQLEVIRASIAKQQETLDNLRANYKNEKYRLISEAKEVIDLERQRLQIDNASELNRIEEVRLRTQSEISQNKKELIKTFEPQIVEPYQVRIEELEVEIVRLNKLLASNSKKSYAWQVEQIKNIITKKRGEKLEPVHLRIAGESESGKSHLVNQLVTTGLGLFGVNCDFELFDPYPSDTEWSIKPYISEDPDKVLERFEYWTNFVESKDSKKLSRPLILICDEGDEMIRGYKAKFVNCVKALWKRGRHVNIFLWLLGQNGNVKPLSPLDWSDLKNASQIYLNQVSYDYLKNALGSRDTKALQGELDHVASLSEYYAVIQPKMGKAYPVTIPGKLFAEDSKQSSNAVTVLTCPKCGSKDVKRNGNLNNRPRIKCNSCHKQSYAD
jgi:hypothetical protein